MNNGHTFLDLLVLLNKLKLHNSCKKEILFKIENSILPWYWMDNYTK